MNNPNLEKLFFNIAIKDIRYLDQMNQEFFDTEEYKKLLPIHQEFWHKYHKNPTQDQINELVKMKGLESTLTESKIDAIYNVGLSNYDDQWLKENIETFIEYKNLEHSVVDIVSYLKKTTATPENIRDLVDTVKSTILTRNNINFQFDEGLDFFDPQSHVQKQLTTYTSGYSFIDTALEGGFLEKSFNVIAGLPKIGKTIWLCNFAGQAVTNGFNTAYISCEMPREKIIQRIGLNLLDLDSQFYKNVGAGNTNDVKSRINSINRKYMCVPGVLQVQEFGTGQASVLDIENYLKKIEEAKGFRFKFVVIDYVNILKNYRNPNTENLYMKIKQICEDLRAMAQRNNWIIISATQINRNGINNSDLTLSDISESMGLIHTVDSLFAIIQDSMMHSEKYYYLKVLANRHGGHMNSKKKFFVDYSRMRITEDIQSQIITD